MPYEAYYSARDTIFDFIVKDAFGPIEKNEILQEPPLDTYVCGILWPKGTSSADVSFPRETRVDGYDEESPDKNTGAEIEDDLVDNIREANQFRPSVMAISFALPNSILPPRSPLNALHTRTLTNLLREKSMFFTNINALLYRQVC